MSDQTIKLGSTGEAVVKAQRELMLRYYLPPGSDDGTFGPITRNRALRYQLDRADHEYQSLSFPLDVDGVVGTKTWARLAPAVVKRNDEGDSVRLAQEILKHYGRTAYDPGTVDGKFGDSTETAVTNFQRDHSEPDGRPLDVDGVVGPRTWRALWS
jgi:peptidoglycan hydrolase-like protein with peptidoglycan-binding domain